MDDFYNENLTASSGVEMRELVRERKADFSGEMVNHFTDKFFEVGAISFTADNGKFVTIKRSNW